MLPTGARPLLAALLTATLLAAGTGRAPAAPDAATPGAGRGWVRVRYRELVDRRKLTHSGTSVGDLLAKLDGRAKPAKGERPDDAVAYRLLDPVLEPYAFVLPDAIDSLSPPADPPLVEVGSLWEPGGGEPAWVELCRARQLLLESDGEGRIRAFLPAVALEGATPEAPISIDPANAAEQAWRSAWPILRHALEGERRRLARARGGAPPALDVEVHAYRHFLASSTFWLGVAAWKTRVADTSPAPGTVPLDLARLASLLEQGLQIEGGRLDPTGRVRWFTSEPEAKPSILGRSPDLSDLAVAYRAVAHGGEGEPYMSLDRAAAPQDADVNYGGRLRDTAIGMASLLSDVRFKTFSLGIDIASGTDVRDTVRRAIPGFKTHLERFAADPGTGGVATQQTRFWFYPDDVDVALSAQTDVLAFRSARMSAASERVRSATEPTADPPWTRDTVGFLNERHDGLADQFAEIGGLDLSVRWLTLFTWLETARARGLAVPDLDVLLAIDLPPLPTPRRFPQLLSYDVLPPPGGSGAVDVLDRTSVGAALDRLEPPGGKPLPPMRRFRRALSLLDRNVPDQAALATEMDGRSTADASELDTMSFRAERLAMHARVLATLSPADRAAVASRQSTTPGVRIFSIGIGGVDLGTSAVLDRALARRGALDAASAPTGPKPSRSTPEPGPRAAAPSPTVAPADKPSDPPALSTGAWPDHGLGPAAERATAKLAEGNGTIVSRRRPGALIRTGTWAAANGRALAWEEWVTGIDGNEPRSRRRVPDVEGKAPVFERFEDGRFVSYRFEIAADAMRAIPAFGQLPSQAFGGAAVTPSGAAGVSAIPRGLALLDVLPPAQDLPGDRELPPAVGIRLRGADGRARSAPFPRPLLQRLVLGRAVDATPGRPLSGFTPISDLLGEARTLMVMQTSSESTPPWTALRSPLPGEESAARLARALTRWWSEDPATAPAHAVVGVDPATSLTRWSAVKPLDGALTVVAPAEAFPGPSSAWRAPLASLPASSSGASIVLVVSAEAPGVLGRRLRSMADDPATAGKSVAVVSLAGPVRDDLPASLLGAGRLSSVGVLEAGPVGIARALDEVAGWARAATGGGAKGKRPDEVPGPFLWHY